MASFKNPDLVRETSTTTGTTDFTLAGAVSGFRTFNSEVSTGDTVPYVARMGSEYEIGIGTFTSPSTLARTTVLESSNADAKVVFSAGSKDVYAALPHDYIQTIARESLASAATVDLGSVVGQAINITGTTTITSFGSTAKTGAVKHLTFAGALTLTHNATSLIIPGGLDILTVAGDRASVVHEGSGNWRVQWYVRATGEALVVGTVTIASAATTDLGSKREHHVTISGTTTITSFGSTAATGVRKTIVFSGALTLTHNATSLIIPGGQNITTAAGLSLNVVHEGSGNWRVLGPVLANATIMEAAAALDVGVPPGLQHRHPGHPKAWASLNGTGTIALRASYNQSSATDNGVGDWTFNHTTAFSGADYGFSVTANKGAGAGTGVMGSGPFTANPTTSAFRTVAFSTAFATADTEFIGVNFNGDQ